MPSLDLFSTGIIAMMMVPLVSLLKRDHWPNAVNFAISLLLAGVAGCYGVVVTDHVHNFTQFIPYWGVALSTTQMVFHFYFHDSPFDTWLASVFSSPKAQAPAAEENPFLPPVPPVV